jgi:NAD(P)-dependent dehydrogenase (short-subunit alcohol dehydrogenase family)
MRKGDELAGKVALVTGGARNIGRAISRALAAGGAAVMVNARTSEALARETVAMIEQAGGRVHGPLGAGYFHFPTPLSPAASTIRSTSSPRSNRC